MGRTKGATNKKSSSVTVVKVDNQEVKESKPRGRQKGQVIEREPAVVTLLGTEFKTKEDTMNRTLYEKGKSESINEDDLDSNEAGWKFVGHYPPRESSWSYIFDEIVQRLKLKKARKEIIITYERHKELETEARKKAEKIFKLAGFDIVKRTNN